MIDLPVFRLEAFFSKWDPLLKHNIAQSDAETMSIGEVLALGTRRGPRGVRRPSRFGYPLGWGASELRGGGRCHLRWNDGEHVLCFSGAEEALFWAMEELLEPGLHAIVTVPNYQSMESVAIATGADVSGVLLDRATIHGRCDLERRRARRCARTRSWSP